MPRVDVGHQSRNGLYSWGPILYVRIGFDLNFEAKPLDALEVPEVLLPALIDTGALTNCIDASLAEQLQLPIVDRRPVIGVHGPVDTNFHAAQIYVPSMEWIFPDVLAGLPLRTSGQPYYALIGRSFLRRVTLTYQGSTGRAVIQWS